MAENKIKNMSDYFAVPTDGQDVLGKVVYYSLSSILIDRDELDGLCEDFDFPYQPSRRSAKADAFRSATGDIAMQALAQTPEGPQFYKVYCRDNKAPKGTISRELVKEIVYESTNTYKKLANISLNQRSGVFSYDNLAYDPQVEALGHCLQAQEQFELYQRCAGRKQIETVLEHYLYSMQAVKMAVHGKMYFIPKDQMAKVDLFEDFIEALEAHNRLVKHGRLPLDANSMFVADDEKQRGKMSAAFYRSVRKEIEEYEERVTKLIQGNSRSAAVMERWVMRIRGLEQMKAHYEQLLRRELTDLDDEFTSLRYLSDELQIRMRGIMAQRKAVA